jgi:septal ring factor EnvC (AmiA/AmiB activator)
MHEINGVIHTERDEIAALTERVKESEEESEQYQKWAHTNCQKIAELTNQLWLAEKDLKDKTAEVEKLNKTIAIQLKRHQEFQSLFDAKEVECEELKQRLNEVSIDWQNKNAEMNK